MIICDSRKFVFVHVQKTGGSAVTKLLKAQLPDDEVRAVGKRHQPLGQILSTDPEITDYWIFGFVRDPWDRMVSWFNMIDVWRRRSIDPDGATPEQIDAALEGQANAFWRHAARFPTFDDFILQGTEEIPRLRRPQIRYLRAKGRRADFIGRTESLSADLATALEHVGLDASGLTEHNMGKRDRSKYRHYYSPASRDRVADLFAKDIAEFDYEF